MLELEARFVACDENSSTTLMERADGLVSLGPYLQELCWSRYSVSVKCTSVYVSVIDTIEEAPRMLALSLCSQLWREYLR